jgi:hypothetical protein
MSEETKPKVEETKPKVEETKPKVNERVWITFGVPIRDRGGDVVVTALVKQKFDSYKHAMVWNMELALDILEKKHTMTNGVPYNERYRKLIREAESLLGHSYRSYHRDGDKPFPVRLDVYKFANNHKHNLVSHESFNMQRGEHL